MTHRAFTATFFLVAALTIAGITALLVGRYMVSPQQLLDRDSPGYRILYYYRAPRVAAALLVGASLAAAGAVMQGVFRNPLAGPSLLGVVQGAAFGIALSLLATTGYNSAIVELAGFAGGMAAVFLTITIASRMRIGDETYRLILAGIAVSALFSSLVGLAKFLADPYTRLPEIVYWLLGSLAGVSWSDLELMAPPMILGIAATVASGWWINVLSLGDEEARSLGVNTRIYRVLVLSAATMGVAAATAVAGIVSWIGLISPHIARIIYGYDNRYVVAGSGLVGAGIVLACDTAARTLLPYELPLGVTASIVSVIILILLLTHPPR